MAIIRNRNLIPYLLIRIKIILGTWNMIVMVLVVCTEILIIIDIQRYKNYRYQTSVRVIIYAWVSLFYFSFKETMGNVSPLYTITRCLCCICCFSSCCNKRLCNFGHNICSYSCYTVEGRLLVTTKWKQGNGLCSSQNMGLVRMVVVIYYSHLIIWPVCG